MVLEYASYVILERAVPHALDGLKTRSKTNFTFLKELDDGRYNKGKCHWKYNEIPPTWRCLNWRCHGSGWTERNFSIHKEIGAILSLEILRCTSIYRSCLSKFALEVAFNPKTTNWLASYDGEAKNRKSYPSNSRFY